MSQTIYPELGYYALGGHVPNPKPLLDEAKEGERIGLSTIWISERPGTKDVPVLSGAAAASAPNSTIASGLIQNLQTRNPMVVASYASTMMLLTDNKFILGIGPGQATLSDMMGVPRSNMALMGRYVEALRALWSGEAVTAASDGWELNNARLGASLEVMPPIYAAGIGPKSLAWAGTHADGVILHPCLNQQAVASSINVVKTAAVEAGRNPDDVKIACTAITACNLSEEKMLKYVVGRMNTYFMFPLIDVLAKANGWDLGKVEEIKALVRSEAKQAKGGIGDEGVSKELDDLRRYQALYPQEWIHRCNAVGDGDACSRHIRMLLDTGVDKVIIHGSSPSELGDLMQAWPNHRLNVKSANLSLYEMHHKNMGKLC